MKKVIHSQMPIHQRGKKMFGQPSLCATYQSDHFDSRILNGGSMVAGRQAASAAITNSGPDPTTSEFTSATPTLW
jgi:hypothetical protein